MTRKSLISLAAFGSFALLAGAFVFQYLGYAPCKLCLWQRWPHGGAIAIGALALFTGPWLIWAIGGAIAALTTAAIGGYHTGVERGWWEGPTSCTSSGIDLSSMSGTDLLSMDGVANIVMCDEVAWALFGISMASWNMLASLVLAALWIRAIRA